MKCREFEKLILDYIEKELEGEKRKEFIQHMEKCEKCRKMVEDFNYIIEMSRKIEVPPLPADFSIHIPETREVRKLVLLPKVAFAVVCLFFIVFAFFISHPRNIQLAKKSSPFIILTEDSLLPSDKEILQMIDSMDEKEAEYVLDILLRD